MVSLLANNKLANNNSEPATAIRPCHSTSLPHARRYSGISTTRHTSWTQGRLSLTGFHPISLW